MFMICWCVVVRWCLRGLGFGVLDFCLVLSGCLDTLSF